MKTSLLKAIPLALLVLCLSIFFITCQENTKTPPSTTAVATTVTPVPLPTNIVPGFVFPEDTATIINQWLGGYTAQYFDTVSIYKHAWGIWAGLTADSGQKYDGQNLRVYETWLGITDIQTIVHNGKSALTATRGGIKLSRPRQFDHARSMFVGPQKKVNGVIDTITGEKNNGADFWVTVAYDPAAANHVIQNQLLDSSVIMRKMKAGSIGTIPAFPNTSITTKPSYYIGRAKDSLIVIPAWPGPPTPAQNYPDNVWDNWVYIDVHNHQPAGKKIVPVSAKNPTKAQISAATCNLSDFIYFKLDKAAAEYLNQQESSQGVKATAGDLAILVAMHVTSKEISNWTWQSYFWAADPDNPAFPSDKVAASLRPKQLSGAASHYAVTTAYAMTRPNQPITGGKNTGVKAVIGYNPYLEPGLGQLNGPAPNFPNKLSPALMWGMQSNCMSCHALASFPGNPYTADQYISLNDPIFLGKVQLDFAWSIQGNMTNSVSPPQTTKK